MFKKTLKKFIGESNYKKANLLKKYLEVYYYRTLRSCKKKINGKKSKTYKIKKYSFHHGQTYFGYYDITPFSKDNNLILGMVGPYKNLPNLKGEELLVGYFYRDSTDHFQPVGKTTTWCWQMGCRLQWFPEDENTQVIYNKMVDKIYGSVIQDIKSKKILTTLHRPIYHIDKQGKYALSLNFSRLHRLRPGYGYSANNDPSEGKACPEDDGVWLLNLRSGEAQLILTLKQLSEMNPLPTMEGAEHYVNHLAFNPSGNRFLLFHLWINNGHQYNRLITCDRYGKNICILTKKGIVSHYTWKSDTELLITLYLKNVGFRYYLLRDFSNVQMKIGNGLLQEDGHPSYSPDSKLILTDTYPDKYGEQRLLLYTSEQTLTEVLRFFSPVKFRGEVRCDLHPRWDRNGNNICIDSVQNGKRSLYVINFDEYYMEGGQA